MNENDFYSQFQAFMDYLNGLPPMGEDQLVNLGAAAPLLQLFQGLQQGDLQTQYYEMNLAKLQNDFDLSRMEIESNERIQQYLAQKTAQDLLTSQEYTKQAQEGTKQSMNQTARSAYDTQAARYAADAAKFQSLLQQGMVNQPAGYSLNRPYGT